MVSIYVKSDDENKHCGLVIADDKVNLYMLDALESSELMTIRRALSYVKRNISTNKPCLVFSDKISEQTLRNDEYLNHIRADFKIDESLKNSHLEKVCKQRLQQGFRWNVFTKCKEL